MMEEAREHARKLREAVTHVGSSPRKLGVFAFLTVATYVFTVLASFPNYSYQIIAANPAAVLTATRALSLNLIASAGTIGLALTAAYSVVGGLAMTLLLGSASIRGAGGLAPGVAVSGCASCGTGVLGLLGLGGALAALPFQGNLVRAGGIALLVFFVAKTGNPEKCEL